MAESKLFNTDYHQVSKQTIQRRVFVFIARALTPPSGPGAVHLDNSHLLPLRQLLTSKSSCCLTYLILEMRKNFGNQLKLDVCFVCGHCLTPRMVHSGINPNAVSRALPLVDTKQPWSSNPWHKMRVVLILNSFQQRHFSASSITPAREWAKRFGLRAPAVLQRINVSTGSQTFFVCSFDQSKPL